MAKKVVLIIVEGPSDDTALHLGLEQIFARNQLHVEVIHGDLTTEPGVDSSNVVIRVGEVVDRFLANTHLKADDVQQIIHLTDTDGVFIPDSEVIDDPSTTKTLYTPDEIRTPCCTKIRCRNKQKKSCLNMLYKTNKIRGITYRIYFMSCNLEHVLFDQMNCSNQEKEQYAYDFLNKYADDSQGFLAFFTQSDFAIMGNYRRSWDIIQQGKASLHRHTNLGIALVI